jgi:hypothetical protein
MGFFPVRSPSGIPYLAPSDDSSGNTDASNINGLLAQGSPVFLLPGEKYFINQPINKWQDGSFLCGFQNWSASPFDNYGAGAQPATEGGAEIFLVPAFETGHYAFEMTNSTAGKQYFGVDICGVNIYCWDLSGSSVVGGILADGAWGACFLRGVGIIGPTNDCLHLQVDGTTGKVPDDWQVTDCKFSASFGKGVYADNIPDSWFDNCEASGNSVDQWHIANSTNTRFSNCKAENGASAAGWHFTGMGAGNVVALANCTSQLNNQDGWLFDNIAAGGLGTYVLTGCRSLNDDQAASATYAGFRDNGCLSRIMGAGCIATGASYGAYEGGTAYGMCFTGSFFTGTTAATHDDGTNTHALVNQSPVPF